MKKRESGSSSLPLPLNASLSLQPSVLDKKIEEQPYLFGIGDGADHKTRAEKAATIVECGQGVPHRHARGCTPCRRRIRVRGGRRQLCCSSTPHGSLPPWTPLRALLRRS
jgi:hypothetical protein